MASGVSNIGFGVPVAVTTASGLSPSGSVPGAPVHPVAPVPPTAAVGDGGNPSPPAGEPVPPQHAAAAQPKLMQLQAAIEGVNRFLRDSQRQMVYQIDLKSGAEIVTIVNPATGEVIRQIPSTEVLSSAANLQQAGLPMAGLFIDERA
jgi:flagellar protein FlaG